MKNVGNVLSAGNKLKRKCGSKKITETNSKNR
jgi:hypothetical protein